MPVTNVNASIVRETGVAVLGQGQDKLTFSAAGATFVIDFTNAAPSQGPQDFIPTINGTTIILAANGTDNPLGTAYQNTFTPGIGKPFNLTLLVHVVGTAPHCARLVTYTVAE